MYMMTIVLIASTLQEDKIRVSDFCSLILVSKGLLVGAYARVFYYLEQTRTFVAWFLFKLSLGSLGFIYCIYSPSFSGFECAMLYHVLVFYTFLCYGVLRMGGVLPGGMYGRYFGLNGKMMLPIHLEHYTERMGGFIIIVLGVSMDNIAQAPDVPSLTYAPSVVLGFLVVFGLKLMFFDTDVQELHQHAMRVNRYKGVVWVSAIIPWN